MVHQSSDSHNHKQTRLPDASDVVERRQAAERVLSEPTSFKIDPTFESPKHLALLHCAVNPERHPGGIDGFYKASACRLDDQSVRVQEPNCSTKEILAMQNNNAYLIEAATKRVSVVLSKNNRANFVNDGALTMTS